MKKHKIFKYEIDKLYLVQILDGQAYKLDELPYVIVLFVKMIIKPWKYINKVNTFCEDIEKAKFKVLGLTKYRERILLT